ncbi:hypothetical protein EP331_00515 [bacterium]|nr:MAG: hypothetical protein EP331_00515 [bacterium]
MNTAFKITKENQALTLVSTPELFENKVTQTASELLELFGWSDVSESVKSLLQNDMRAFANELLTPFTAIDAETKQRKQRISFWMKQFKAGYCTEATLCEMLAD